MAATYNEEKVSKCGHIILDIEGTTTSITFVKDILFPYACNKVVDFLEKEWEVEGVQEAVEGMRLQAEKDVLNNVEGAVPIPDKDASKENQIKGVAENLKWLISIDNKGTFMKKLSGLIWEKGYVGGDLKGHVYSDVPAALESWKSMGKNIYIYSSGSVHAQKLLMKHSEMGDLSNYFKGNFDTAVGHKQELNSYKNIVKSVGCQPDDAFFITDVVKEAEAANEAGLNVCLVVRDGNAPLTEEDTKKYHTIKSFDGIKLLAASSKRKQEDEQEESRPTKVAKTEGEISDDSKKTDDVPKEIVDSMEVDNAKDSEKTGEDIKPTTETDKNTEKKTEDTESSAKEQVPEIMETEVGNEKPSEKVAAKEETANVVESAEPVEISDQVPKEETFKVHEELKEVVDSESKGIVNVNSSLGVESEKETSAVDKEVDADKPMEDANQDIKDNPVIVDEESKSSLDNINVDIAVDADEEEKITDLLDAGEALDKECDDILSKVDQVTSKDLTVKPFIEKEISNKDAILDDAMEVINEEVNPKESSESRLTDDTTDAELNGASAVIQDTDKDKISESKSPSNENKIETETESSKETVDNGNAKDDKSENSHSEKTNGDSVDHLGNGSKVDDAEVNGSEASETVVEKNGSNSDAEQKTNGANGSEEEAVGVKAKKVCVEEVSTDQTPVEAET